MDSNGEKSNYSKVISEIYVGKSQVLMNSFVTEDSVRTVQAWGTE